MAHCLFLSSEEQQAQGYCEMYNRDPSIAAALMHPPLAFAHLFHPDIKD